ncbi:MAG: hypothetical protein ACK4FV_04415 [Candidatus Nitrosocaldus sp.]
MLEEIVRRYEQYPLALIGCRARTKDLAYDVCEYNILLLEDDSSNNNIHGYSSLQEGSANACKEESYKHMVSDEYIYMDDGSIARIHKVSSRYSSRIVESTMLMDGMIILNDINGRLSMLEAKIAEVSKRIKRMHARALTVDALFYASNAIHAKDALEASFLLKSAACSYIEACILFNDSVPMPSHILAQIRAVSDANMSTIMECLGLEQANRSSTARAIRALMHILADNYNRLAMMVIRKKLEYLSSMGMYTDAYTYLCYTCRGLMASKERGMSLDRKSPAYDMLAIAMNLSSDHVYTSRLANSLLSICKARLKTY